VRASAAVANVSVLPKQFDGKRFFDWIDHAIGTPKRFVHFGAWIG
jgi:hypothetical protein